MKEIEDGGSVNEYLKELQDIFNSLAVLEDPVTEEKQVMFILPESFQPMITALSNSTDTVPPLHDVKERIRSEEMRQKQTLQTFDDAKKALATGQRQGNAKKTFTCHFCHKPGHFKRDCRKWAVHLKKNEKQQSASTAEEAAHALASVREGRLVVDSGATCHMCNDKAQFPDLRKLSTCQRVTLGDENYVEATAEGTVIEALLPDGSTQMCTLRDVLHVPDLSYRLLTLPKFPRLGRGVCSTTPDATS